MQTFKRNPVFLCMAVGIVFIVLQQLSCILSSVGMITIRGPTERYPRYSLLSAYVREAHDSVSKPKNGARMPKIIHQLWKTNDVSTYSQAMNTSKNMWLQSPLYSSYKYKLTNDTQIWAIVQQDYPWLKDLYKSYAYNIQRADIAKLILLHKFGGIYADLDAFPSARSLEMFNQHDVVLPGSSIGSVVTNHVMMAKPGSQFIEYLLHEAINTNKFIAVPYLHVFESTGPLFLTRSLHKYAKLGRHGTEDIVVIDDNLIRRFVYHKAGRSWQLVDGFVINGLIDQPVRFIAGLCVFVISAFCIFRRCYAAACGKNNGIEGDQSRDYGE